MIASILTYIIIALFILLWTYVSIPKFFNIRRFKLILNSQAIPKWLAAVLTWLLPVSQFAIIYLLIFPDTRLIGLYISLFMMLAFTFYAGGVIFQVYERTPCPCGGLFSRMSWKKHFRINMLLTFIALIGVVLMELGY